MEIQPHRSVLLWVENDLCCYCYFVTGGWLNTVTYIRGSCFAFHLFSFYSEKTFHSILYLSEYFEGYEVISNFIHFEVGNKR